MSGGRGADTFRFSDAQDGDAVRVQGGRGTDTIDLSEYPASAISSSGNTLTVDLGAGESFQIIHSNIEHIVTADGELGEAQDLPPVANAGGDLVVEEGDAVSLAGGGTDPEGQGVTYSWVQTGGPTVSLDDPSSANPTFTAPELEGNAEITFELQVSDGTNTSVDTVSVQVEADNDAPTAIAESSEHAQVGDTVSLTGSGFDPDSPNLTFQWVQTAGPEVSLSDATTPEPTFQIPEGFEGRTLVFELQVSDGDNVTTSTVEIDVFASLESVAEPSEISSTPTPTQQSPSAPDSDPSEAPAEASSSEFAATTPAETTPGTNEIENDSTPASNFEIVEIQSALSGGTIAPVELSDADLEAGFDATFVADNALTDDPPTPDSSGEEESPEVSTLHASTSEPFGEEVDRDADHETSSTSGFGAKLFAGFLGLLRGVAGVVHDNDERNSKR
jgi:hypothetical protein